VGSGSGDGWRVSMTRLWQFSGDRWGDGDGRL
jgi:hypothetical protein